MRLLPAFLGSIALLGLAATPPHAGAQPPGTIALAPSAAFGPDAAALQALIRKGDFMAARTALSGLDGKAVTAEDRYLLGNFQLETGLHFNDAAAQRKGLTMMLASGLVPAADAPRFHYYAGQFALNARDYADARLHLQAAADGNHGGASTQIYLAEAYFGQAQDRRASDGYDAGGRALVRQGLPHLRRAIAIEQASGKAVDPQWVWRGVDMARMAQDPDARAWRLLAGRIAPKTAAGM